MKKLYLGKKLSDKTAMALAIKEAYKGLGFTSPNPLVGCVILNKQREFLSSGFYSHYGAIHAEIMALNKIKNKKLLEQAHLFVTLEPCAHFGQNPPCVKELVKYPWAGLTYGLEDPNPKTNMKSIKKLKSKGFKIKKTSFFNKELQRLYEAFSVNMLEKRTFFALKTAGSLDGVSAFSHGESQWITSEKSRNSAHELRAGFSAVLVGVNTFLQDNPRLNCRLKTGKNRVNKALILDPTAQSFSLIEQSNLARVRPMKDIYVVSQIKPSQKTAFQVIQVSNKYPLDLKELAYKLYKKGLESVLVEGGIETWSQFLEQKQAQRLYSFINFSLLGGKRGRYWTDSLKIDGLNSKKQLKSAEILDISNEDLYITGLLS